MSYYAYQRRAVAPARGSPRTESRFLRLGMRPDERARVTTTIWRHVSDLMRSPVGRPLGEHALLQCR